MVGVTWVCPILHKQINGLFRLGGRALTRRQSSAQLLGGCPPAYGGCFVTLLARGVDRAGDSPIRYTPIPLTGKIDVFSLRGPPAYYTSIGLGTSRGALHQNQHLGRLWNVWVRGMQTLKRNRGNGAHP